MPQNKKLKLGFTLIELLVVIAIIGVLSTMAIIALGNARSKARDSKRVADIKQISTALELYYADNNSYPTIITPGNSIVSPDGTKTYMATVPNNPTPRNDNNCGNNNYTYASTPDNTNYSLNFCLGNNVSSTPSGINSASSSGVGTAPGLVAWYKFDEGSGTTAYDSSGNNNNGTWTGAAPYYGPGNIGSYSGQFNGDYPNPGGNYVYTNYPAAFGMQSFTILLWVNLAARARGDIIANKSMSTTAPGFHLWMEGDLNLIIANRIGDGVNSGGGYVIIGNSYIDKWVHVAFVTNRVSNNYIKYLNGAVSGTPDSLSGFGNINNESNLFIGGGSWVNSRGYLDDVRIYNRALSDTEIKAIYDASKP
ncbi:MAG: prepilin-type N-terminal cleavage/methylation domain-containing protein [Candidatus Falkowbacteria bacterium]|nr:prepilin-type N-terminal cleavage/methylation domain-containing protein [Candidatus Falkowbacteria bacterium]